MAATRIIPIHRSKGKSLQRCLNERLNYVTNPAKTKGGELISSYACDPKTAAAEFLLSKKEYEEKTGRKQEHDVILYQVRQSFKPTEITPEEANRIGYEFAKRFIKGNHAFIVCTHVDKAHIHNHIEWNSTSLDCTHKFRNFSQSAEAVRKLSDLICMEHKLSTIENPQKSIGGYSKADEQRKPTHRDMLRQAIDEMIRKHPKDIEELIDLLSAAGYTAKRGKHMAFRHEGQKKYLRLDSLGKGYSENELREALKKQEHSEPAKSRVGADNRKRSNLLTDIDAKLNSGKGANYMQWAKVFRLKQMAKTIMYIDEKGFEDYGALAKAADDSEKRFDELKAKIKTAEARMAEIQTLRTHIINYLRTKNIYTAYRKSGYSKKFLSEHEGDIILHKAAKKAFDELNMKKLPTIKALNTEFSHLLTEKKAAYKEYRNAKEEMRELRVHEANTAYILGLKRCGNQIREQERNEK